ncbi:MAG: nucleotidyl transferase AbiEii/AbiGii toxin family protein [Elusimicrobia bacterium]|nr:nucleotidyl transferase AbiEii/AbiGii toxin family protein [Elusimicrobiota bacterium]
MIEQRYAELFTQGSQVRIEIAEREIALTYVLKILDDAGLLKTLAFKGGTCLRKCVYGKATRFSVDLDFTSVGTMVADDVILTAVEALGKPAYGLSFEIDAKDFYVSDDGLSCGANVKYRHDWSQGTFKLEISLREAPSLPLQDMPLIPQPYSKYLEFKPFAIQSFQFEELLAEKIRASSQRVRSRDLYDLAKAAERPIKAQLIRSLAAIKCWNVGKPFEPERLLERLRSGRYDWDDLRQFVRKSEKIDPERLISACEKRYRFLLDLSEGEKRLIADAKRRQLKDLPRTLLKEAGQWDRPPLGRPIL